LNLLDLSLLDLGLLDLGLLDLSLVDLTLLDLTLLGLNLLDLNLLELVGAGISQFHNPLVDLSGTYLSSPNSTLEGNGRLDLLYQVS
jgi:hypothetical protein